MIHLFYLIMIAHNDVFALPAVPAAAFDLDAHPRVVEYLALMEANVQLQNYTAAQRQLVADAHTLRDYKLNVTLNQLMEKARKSLDVDPVFLISHQIRDFLKDKFGNHANDLKLAGAAGDAVGAAAAGGDALLLQAMADFKIDHSLWRASELRAEELAECLNTGIIRDIHSYYTYMCTHHLDDVFGAGW